MDKILSSGIIPFILEEEPKFLLLRCFKYWDFPKGQVEKGEAPQNTALREFKEETGVLSDIKISKNFIVTETYGNNKTARYYLGFLPHRPIVELLANPQSGIFEHHEFRWVTYDEGMKLVVPRIQKIFYWANSNIKDKSIPK